MENTTTSTESESPKTTVQKSKLYTESENFGKFKEDEMKNLKLKYGKRLRFLRVKTEDGDSEFIIKKPSRATSMAVRDALDKDNEDLAATIMLSNCVIAGDIEDIEEDAVVFTKVSTFITTMVNEAEMEAKKL